MALAGTAPRALAVVLVSVLLAGCVNIPPGLFGPRRGPLRKEVLQKAEGASQGDILVIDLKGMVTINGDTGLLDDQPGMLVALKDRLEAAAEDKKVKAVILRISTPGGGVTASDLIWKELNGFKLKTADSREQPLPVVAFMEDLATSGGLYVAMAADEVYATPTTVTGSIGVLTILPGLTGLSEKIGLSMRVIKSGEMKDAGSPWRELTEEERKHFQDLIDSMQERFVSIVLDARKQHGLNRETLMPVADGRILKAAEASDLGLIDGVAYFEDVLVRAKKMAGIEHGNVVSYEYPGAYRGNIYARTAVATRQSLAPKQVNLLNLDFTGRMDPAGTRFFYLWMP